MKRTVFLLGIFGLVAMNALAGGTAMPWNAGLTSISDNLTGPTALGLTILGAGGAIAPMVFHGEIPQVVHRAGYLFIAGGAMLGIKAVVNFMGISGALV